MEEIDQTKDQGKNTRRLWKEMRDKTKSRTIKSDTWEKKNTRNRTVQRRYSRGHHQNQATHVGPELKERGRTTIMPIVSNRRGCHNTACAPMWKR